MSNFGFNTNPEPGQERLPEERWLPEIRRWPRRKPRSLAFARAQAAKGNPIAKPQYRGWFARQMLIGKGQP